MNPIQALKTLQENENAEHESFLEYLHEDSRFHETAFWEYCDCIKTLAKYPELAKKEDVIEKVYHTYRYILHCLLYHFDPKDLRCIEGLPAHYMELIEKLSEAFHSFITVKEDNVIATILKRTSYRGAYREEAIPREDLRLIMECGLAAPSGCNKQTTSLIAVDDTAILQRIKGLLHPPICQTAPAFIVVLSQEIYAYRKKCYSIQDYSACIENMLLAIQVLGYDSCWYEGHITDEDDIAGSIAEVLQVPDAYRVVCLLPVGIATEKRTKTSKKEFHKRAWFYEPKDEEKQNK